MDADPGAIPIIMILEMDFNDRASLDRSLASDIKERSHALTLAVLKPFKGRFFHLVANAHSVPPEWPKATCPVRGHRNCGHSRRAPAVRPQNEFAAIAVHDPRM